MSITRKWIPSPNYSSRGGAKVRLIVVHTAEGATNIEDLGNFFKSASAGVSSHTGADDKKNIIGEYVKRGNKAWTAANANPVAVQIELCAFAKWSKDEWMRHPNMLANCAAWIKEEAGKFGIPIVKLNDSQAQGSGKGVCQHENLGSWGGGHWDCGSGFPMDHVLDLATGGSDDEMGYPNWFWDWLNWYQNTSRDPKKRPDSAPEKIPDWAWEGQKEVLNLSNRYGMTVGERDWVDWVNHGKEGTRPDVYETIPERWWDDQVFCNEQKNR